MLTATIVIYDHDDVIEQGGLVVSVKRQFELICNQRNQVRAEIQQVIDSLTKLKNGYDDGPADPAIGRDDKIGQGLIAVGSYIWILRHYIKKHDTEMIDITVDQMTDLLEGIVSTLTPRHGNDFREEAGPNVRA